MADLNYEAVPMLTRELVTAGIESGQPEKISGALYSATYHDHDWRWVQTQCLRFLGHPDLQVRWTAATCLGDLAMFHKMLDVDLVVPNLIESCEDPTIRDAAETSLSLIRQFAQEQG